MRKEVIQSDRPLRAAFKMLEPCDGKLSRTVLRGEGSRKAPALPGMSKKYIPLGIYLDMR